MAISGHNCMVNCSLKKLPMLPNDSNFGDVRPDASTDGTGELDGFLATPGARRNSETWPSMMTNDWDLYSVLIIDVYTVIFILYIRIIYSDSVIHTYNIYIYTIGLALCTNIFICTIICLIIYFSLLDMNWNWIAYINPETLVFWLFAADFPWRQSTAQFRFTKNLGLFWPSVELYLNTISPFLQQEIWLKIRGPLDLSPQKVLPKWRWLKPVDQPCFPQLQLDGWTLVVYSCNPSKSKVPLWKGHHIYAPTKKTRN